MDYSNPPGPSTFPLGPFLLRSSPSHPSSSTRRQIPFEAPDKPRRKRCLGSRPSIASCTTNLYGRQFLFPLLRSLWAFLGFAASCCCVRSQTAIFPTPGEVSFNLLRAAVVCYCCPSEYCLPSQYPFNIFNAIVLCFFFCFISCLPACLAMIVGGRPVTDAEKPPGCLGFVTATCTFALASLLPRRALPLAPHPRPLCARNLQLVLSASVRVSLQILQRKIRASRSSFSFQALRAFRCRPCTVHRDCCLSQGPPPECV
jgi:hypothetical protein